MINLSMGGDILADIVGLLVGYIYIYGKDKFALNYGYELLPTPLFL